MRITDFHKTKAGRIALFVDDAFYMSMHPDVFVAAGLEIGSELDEDALAELAAEAQLKKAKEKAFALLSYKEYTQSELEQRLRRHVDADAAEAAVERMRELGLVNDRDYAERYFRQLVERKGYGRLRVKQELRRKGIDAELIEELLAERADDDPTETIRAALHKKYPAAWDDEQVRRRAYAAMLRLGYTSAEVRRALEMEQDYDCGIEAEE